MEEAVPEQPTEGAAAAGPVADEARALAGCGEAVPTPPAAERRAEDAAAGGRAPASDRRGRRPSPRSRSG